MRATLPAAPPAAPPSPSNASVRSAGNLSTCTSAYAPSVVSSSAVGLELDSFDACVQALSAYTRQHQVGCRTMFYKARRSYREEQEACVWV